MRTPDKAETLKLDMLKLTVRKLKSPLLKRLRRQSFRMYQAVIEGLSPEQRREIEPVLEHVTQTWQLFYREEDRRNLVDAERKDRGEVLFTVFYPRKYSWERQKVVTRTPHRRIEESWLSDCTPIVQVVSPGTWLADFQRAQVAA